MGNAFRENLLTKKDPDGFLRRGLCDCCSAEMNHTFHFLLNSSVEWIDDTISLKCLLEDKEDGSKCSPKHETLNFQDWHHSHCVAATGCPESFLLEMFCVCFFCFFAVSFGGWYKAGFVAGKDSE